ncbi:hypothetical protein AOQ84DRAFT_184626, partial [Glonium stellatum]
MRMRSTSISTSASRASTGRASTSRTSASRTSTSHTSTSRTSTSTSTSNRQHLLLPPHRPRHIHRLTPNRQAISRPRQTMSRSRQINRTARRTLRAHLLRPALLPLMHLFAEPINRALLLRPGSRSSPPNTTTTTTTT